MGLLTLILTLVIIVAMYETVEAKMTIEQIKNTMRPYKTKCLRTTGVDPAIVEATKQGIFKDDRALKCFTKCIFTMMKVIKNDDVSLKAVFSTIDLMVPDEFVPPMKKICEECLIYANSQTNDLCEKTWIYTKCFYEADSSLYFFP